MSATPFIDFGVSLSSVGVPSEECGRSADGRSSGRFGANLTFANSEIDAPYTPHACTQRGLKGTCSDRHVDSPWVWKIVRVGKLSSKGGDI